MADIFTEEELEALKVAETEAQEQPEAQPPEQPRDEQGRFATKEAEQPEAKTEEKQPEGTVPQGALHAERERRKGVEAELKKAQEQLQAIGKLREQMASRTAPETPAVPTDDAGLKHLSERLTQIEQGRHTDQQQRDEALLQNAELQQLNAIAEQSDAAFRASNAEYDNAINYLVNARATELGYHGYNPVQIRQIITSEAADIVRSAVMQGRDPAEMAWNIAAARGFRAGIGEASAHPGQAQRTVDAIAQAKSQSRSLGQAAGATPKQLNGEAIAGMSDDEFAALYDTPDGKRLIDAIMMGNA